MRAGSGSRGGPLAWRSWQRPGGTPAAPWQHPGSAPAAPRQHPGSALAAPRQRPGSTGVVNSVPGQAELLGTQFITTRGCQIMSNSVPRQACADMCRRFWGTSGRPLWDILGSLRDLWGMSAGALGEIYPALPGSALAAPRQRPGSTPAAPWQHPGSTPAAPRQHPGSAPGARGCEILSPGRRTSGGQNLTQHRGVKLC